MKYADKLRNKYKERRMKNVIEPSEKESSMSILQEPLEEYKPQFNITKVTTNTEMTAIEAEEKRKAELDKMLPTMKAFSKAIRNKILVAIRKEGIDKT